MLQSYRGLWKHGEASYAYHIPLQYVIVEKGQHGSFKHPYSWIKIRPLSHGHTKQETYPVIWTHSKESVDIVLKDHTFWIPRRIIRRGPKSWKKLTNRWVHENTFRTCLARAYKGNEEYLSPGWGF